MLQAVFSHFLPPKIQVQNISAKNFGREKFLENYIVSKVQNGNK